MCKKKFIILKNNKRSVLPDKKISSKEINVISVKTSTKWLFLRSSVLKLCRSPQNVTFSREELCRARWERFFPETPSDRKKFWEKFSEWISEFLKIILVGNLCDKSCMTIWLFKLSIFPADHCHFILYGRLTSLEKSWQW